jgi:biopolymer transport protein ExbB/TolQ
VAARAREDASCEELRAARTSLRSATARAALRQRIEQVMGVTIQREMEGIEKRLGFLATVGAICPFVGLFGTVWGIVNALIRITASGVSSVSMATARLRKSSPSKPAAGDW